MTSNEKMKAYIDKMRPDLASVFLEEADKGVQCFLADPASPSACAPLAWQDTLSESERAIVDHWEVLEAKRAALAATYRKIRRRAKARFQQIGEEQ